MKDLLIIYLLISLSLASVIYWLLEAWRWWGEMRQEQDESKTPCRFHSEKTGKPLSDNCKICRIEEKWAEQKE